MIGPLLDYVRRNISKCNSKEFKQFIFILCREQRTTIDHFEKDAAEGPHVDRMVVGYAEHDLGCSIHSALDIGKASLIALTAGSKINNFDLICIFIREENVLWLDITVYYTLGLHVEQTFANLLGNLLDLKITEALVLATLRHHLLIEIQIQ